MCARATLYSYTLLPCHLYIDPWYQLSTAYILTNHKILTSQLEKVQRRHASCTILLATLAPGITQELIQTNTQTYDSCKNSMRYEVTEQNNYWYYSRVHPSIKADWPHSIHSSYIKTYRAFLSLNIAKLH